MILILIVLSIVAAFIGSVVGSLYWTFQLGLRWLRSVLSNESALSAFWLLFFKPHGGVAAMLRGEGSVLDRSDETTAFACSSVIRVEAETFYKMRRYCVMALCVLFLLYLVVSAYTSIMVVSCFVCGALVSIPLRNQSYATQTLATLFRSVRIWMGADRQSLEEYCPECLRGIVRVIEANEPVEQSPPSNVAA
jgi:hypothetical protein